MDLPVSESLVNFHFPVNTALVDAVVSGGMWSGTRYHESMMSSLRWRRVRCRGRRRPPARTNPGRAPPLGAGGRRARCRRHHGSADEHAGRAPGNVRAQWPLHALAPNRLAAAPGAPAHAGRVLYRKALIFAATSSWPALHGQSQRVRVVAKAAALAHEQ
jgi:hypothetical protein